LSQKKNHPILKKKGTLRENQTDKFKFDFSTNTIKLGLNGGITFKINYASFDENKLKIFLINKLG
jgi:hypothetical protein